jgi:hypothetical protein
LFHTARARNSGNAPDWPGTNSLNVLSDMAEDYIRIKGRTGRKQSSFSSCQKRKSEQRNVCNRSKNLWRENKKRATDFKF